MHSISWEQSNNGEKRKDTQIEVLIPNNNQHSDSFFNRVFGHHSPESSRGKGSCLFFLTFFLFLSFLSFSFIFPLFFSFFFSSNYFNILFSRFTYSSTLRPANPKIRDSSRKIVFVSVL